MAGTENIAKRRAAHMAVSVSGWKKLHSSQLEKKVAAAGFREQLKLRAGTSCCFSPLLVAAYHQKRLLNTQVSKGRVLI